MGKKNSKLSNQEMDELTRLTHFSPKELNTWYRGFLKDCPSGTLNKEEFCKIYRQFFPFGDPTHFASFMFSMFDCDQNGLVSFKEFAVALSVTSQSSLEDKLQWTFQLFDSDHDGYISRQDMQHVVEAIYKMVGHMVTFPQDEATPQQRVNKLFELMDQDKDDVISIEDFLQGAKRDPSILKAISLYEGLHM